MKKALVFVMLVFAGMMANKAQAQVRSNVVKINPLSLAFATFNFSYERAISENKSAQLGLFYTNVGIGDLSYSGIGVTPEFRFYLSGSSEAPEGFHISPFIRFQSLSMEYEDSFDGTNSSKASSTIFGGGAVAGYQWLFGASDRISLDLFIGPSYNSMSMKIEEGSENDFDVSGAFSGFSVRSGLTLGVAF